MDGHLDCFQLIISSAAKNNIIHMYFAYVQVYLGESSYRGIAVSKAVCVCNFDKCDKLPFFPEGCNNLNFHSNA